MNLSPETNGCFALWLRDSFGLEIRVKKPDTFLLEDKFNDSQRNLTAFVVDCAAQQKDSVY